VGGRGERERREWERGRWGASSAKERRREIEREGVLEERWKFVWIKYSIGKLQYYPTKTRKFGVSIVGYFSEFLWNFPYIYEMEPI
jgi:hypothetical protein